MASWLEFLPPPEHERSFSAWCLAARRGLPVTRLSAYRRNGSTLAPQRRYAYCRCRLQDAGRRLCFRVYSLRLHAEICSVTGCLHCEVRQTRRDQVIEQNSVFRRMSNAFCFSVELFHPFKKADQCSVKSRPLSVTGSYRCRTKIDSDIHPPLP